MTRPLPLRRTLIIAIAALIATLTLAIAAFSTIALRGDLIGRLDAQLTAATDRSFDRFSPGNADLQPSGPPETPKEDASRPPSGTDVLRMPGQREGTIAGTIARSTTDSYDNTATSVQLITTAGTLRSLTAEEQAGLVATPNDGLPRTVTVGDLGDYRVVAWPAGIGSSESFVMGLPLAEVNTTVLRLALLISIAGVAGIVLAVIAGTLIVRLALRPLDRIASTATQVSTIPLDQGTVTLTYRVDARDADPATEVGQVGEALNTLLDHVATSLSARQASEEKLRRFVADASHELRTPLASIRGYAELTRRSPEVLPEQAAHTISRIESESVRMTSLVEDLLLLARLDEGDRMRRDPVDLTQLLADAMSDAQAAGPAHRWKLLLPPKPVVVSGDQLRLHQVIANLCSNARTHTPEGTLVTASLRVEDTAAVLEVRDTGPGIDGVIIDTLFERFVRADTARSRNTGSTGLGLAITAAIITAHNGTISVASEPGNTVFTVTLQTAKRD